MGRVYIRRMQHAENLTAGKLLAILECGKQESVLAAITSIFNPGTCALRTKSHHSISKTHNNSQSQVKKA